MSDASDKALNQPEARPAEILSAFVRLLMRVFFRQVEVIGAERVPRDRPLMVVANHVNSLVDPGLLLAFLPVRPRFLAKSTLWRENVMVRFFIRLAAAIPVFRRQDAGVDTSKNEEMFSACHAVLHAGNTIALFPEGKSHNEPGIVPLRTGVSRIVLEASRLYAETGKTETGKGDLGVCILPVGLTFDDKGRFRSRALMLIGEPVDPSPELADYSGEDSREAVRALTDRVYTALRRVTLNFPSWEVAPLLERAAEIFARPTAALPAEPSLAERFGLYRTFIEGYAELRESHGEEIERVQKAVREYDRRLEELGLTDVQVAAHYPTGGVARFVLKSALLMMLRGPLAFLGTVVNYLPYRVVGAVAKRMASSSPDLPATYKLFSSMVLFPATWLLLALAVFFAVGPWWGLAALVLGPLSGAVALSYHERREHFLRQSRAYLVIRSGGPEIAELRRLRGEVLAAVQQLALAYQP